MLTIQQKEGKDKNIFLKNLNNKKATQFKNEQNILTETYKGKYIND